MGTAKTTMPKVDAASRRADGISSALHVIIVHASYLLKYVFVTRKSVLSCVKRAFHSRAHESVSDRPGMPLSK